MQLIKVNAWSKCGNIEFLGVFLPFKSIVCPRCNGTGKHVNPAIDEHGLTHEDFSEDPDFAESYFSGVYDVRCELCQGMNVIQEVDETTCKQKLSWWKGLIRYRNALRLESDSRIEDYYERMAGT